MTFSSLRFLLVITAVFSGLASLSRAQSSSFTLSPLPDYTSGGAPVARANVVGLSPAGEGSWTITGKPGDTVGWGFKITWESNAGDSLLVRDSVLSGDLALSAGESYKDFIGEQGGNNAGRILSGGTWENAFSAATSQGIGRMTLSGAPGSNVTGQLTLHLAVYDQSGAEPVHLRDFTISVDVTVSIVAPEPAPQTITFAAIPTKSVADETFTVTATASSTLPVQIISLQPDLCTVTDGVATVHAAGTCTFVAQQLGNDFFAEAPLVYQTFEITKIPATVTIQGALERIFNGTDQLFTAQTEPASLPVRWLYNGLDTPPRAAGIYIVTAVIDSPTHEGRAQVTAFIDDPSPAPLVAYANWLLTHFSPEEIREGLVTARNADLAEDGLSNLFKYALGLDPWTTMSPEARAALPRFVRTGNANGLVFSLPATPAGDVNIAVEASSDLVTWTEIARRTQGGAWTGTATVTAGAIDGTTLRAETLVAEPAVPVHPNRFYRLKVEFVP